MQWNKVFVYGFMDVFVSLYLKPTLITVFVIRKTEILCCNLSQEAYTYLIRTVCVSKTENQTNFKHVKRTQRCV